VFSSTTIASSTTNRGDRERHQRELLSKPARYMTPKVPMSDTGRRARINVRPLRGTGETTSTTSATEDHQRAPRVAQRCRIVVVRSIASVTVSRSESTRAQQHRCYAIDRVMMLALSWRLMMTSTDGRPLAMPALRILHRSTTSGDVGQHDGGAVHTRR
jgi:hypothetical protein